MAEKIKGGVLSPMIEDGVLYWCRGDTFSLTLILDLFAMGEKCALSTEDEIEVSFYDKSDWCVKRFSSNAENDNRITLNFDEETSSAFDKGRYLYNVCVLSRDGVRQTVAHGNTAVVL